MATYLISSLGRLPNWYFKRDLDLVNYMALMLLFQLDGLPTPQCGRMLGENPSCQAAVSGINYKRILTRMLALSHIMMALYYHLAEKFGIPSHQNLKDGKTVFGNHFKSCNVHDRESIPRLCISCNSCWPEMVFL